MPEEQNRIVADHLSRMLLAPSRSAIENLHREGIGLETDPQKRHTTLVGDVMYDALLQNQELAERNADENLRQYGLENGKYYLLTLHRAENTESAGFLQEILEAVGRLELPVLFPVHPRTKHFLDSTGIPLNGALRPIPPVGYLQMLGLEKHACKILTDSGGVQKEAFYLGVPCVTLREATEWPETVELGANCVAGRSATSIHEAVLANHQKEWSSSTPYGDGRAASRIVEELLRLGGHQDSPQCNTPQLQSVES
jgi:UDP-GlcNAc3NAcA epimerase